MRKNIGIVYTAFWVVICACYGQATTNGTELADNLTSQSRVVVDAFENASNRVHSLIQEVSPAPDLSGYATTGAVAAVSNAVAQKADKEIVSVETNTILIASGMSGAYPMSYSEVYTEQDTMGRAWYFSSYGMGGSWDWSYGVYDPYGDTIFQGSSSGNTTERPASILDMTPTYQIYHDGYDSWQEAFSERAEETGDIYFEYGVNFNIVSETTNYVVYSDLFVPATNALAAMMDGKLSTTGGVVTGNIILPQTQGSGDKTTINGNGITSGDEGFTIDSYAATLALMGSSATINFPDIRLLSGWDSLRDNNGYSVPYLLNATNDFVRKSDFGQTITNVAEGVTGNATNALAVALGDSIELVRQTASTAINNVDYLEQFTIPAWRTADLLAATNFTKAYIATNNPAFVAAVTNCPVAIAAADAEALTEWGIYGGGGTIGALLAALAAAVAALKKKKMPLYPVGGSGNPVNAAYESGVLTISPFSMAAYAPTASAAFSVVMGVLPSDMEAGKARDAVLVIDCTSLTEGQEPTVTWDTHYHPRTDAGTDFACVTGAKNVYYISEYATGEFAVGGWTETTGGNT